jgi:hypothetical protein
MRASRDAHNTQNDVSRRRRAEAAR